MGCPVNSIKEMEDGLRHRRQKMVIVILANWSLTCSFDLYMVRQQPLNVCMGGVAVTLNTRYERLCVEHLMSLAHFPRTGVFIEYD